MSAPKFSIHFKSAKVVNLDTGEERVFEDLGAASADSIAGKGLDTLNAALEAAGGSEILPPVEDEWWFGSRTGAVTHLPANDGNPVRQTMCGQILHRDAYRDDDALTRCFRCRKMASGESGSETE